MSVVIPVYNRSHFLPEAVRSALEQEYEPLEIIVVDDGSTEDISSAIAFFGDKVRLVRQSRGGRSRARNRGIDSASGQAVAFLDSDDRWLPSKLRRQATALASNPSLGFVCGFVKVIDGQGIHNVAHTNRYRESLARTSACDFCVERLVISPGIYTSTLLMPKVMLEEIGGFDESLDALEDWDLMLRVRAHAPAQTVPWPPVAEYRVHSDNTDSEEMAKATISVSERHMKKNLGLGTRELAAFQLRKARAERQLVQQENARRSALRALAAAPGKTIEWGGLRLLAGSLMPRRLAAVVAGIRSKSVVPPERIDPEEASPGIVAHHLAKYHFAAALLKGPMVLDVGCGLGYGAEALAHPSRFVVGVDVSIEAITAGSRRYGRPGLRFGRMDAEQLAFRSRIFDAAVCFEAIEHLANPEHHLEEVARVLRPEGIYIVSTPQPSHVKEGTFNPYHRRDFTYEDFRRMLEKYFKEVKVVGQRRERSRLYLVLRKLDPLAIRKWPFLRPLLRRVARLLRMRATEDAHISDFKLDRRGVGTGSEFVGICRRPIWPRQL